MRPTDLIAKKRDGGALTADEIQFLVDGFTRGTIPDYQIAAWLMAVYLRGMTKEETVALTLAMAHSGRVLDLSDVKAQLPITNYQLPLIADKHSTGGVGDKTTIAVAPLVAACGVPIGKMSGRGLGHTGGTLDKLEAIAGFNINLSSEQFKENLRKVGLVVAGQSPDLAPADGRLYALRDVTATVASLPLIASSIMSKKIAAGADAIVLDVKVGKGAFMQTLAEAVALAEIMIEIGQGVGRKVSAVIADMNQPLGNTVGNALEVMEAIAMLRPPSSPTHLPSLEGLPDRESGEGVRIGVDFREHCMVVAGEMLQLVGRARDEAEAQTLLHEAITSGRALQKFREWIAAQSGDARVADDFGLFPQARFVETVNAPRSGYVAALNAMAVGASAMRLGAGRMKKGDTIELAVGIVLHKKIGDAVQIGEPLCTIHANAEKTLRAEQETLLSAYQWSDEAVTPPPHILKVISEQ
jgi:pyrimidine-nucleoside phosphorylase